MHSESEAICAEGSGSGLGAHSSDTAKATSGKVSKTRACGSGECEPTCSSSMLMIGGPLGKTVAILTQHDSSASSVDGVSVGPGFQHTLGVLCDRSTRSQVACVSPTAVPLNGCWHTRSMPCVWMETNMETICIFHVHVQV